MDETVIDTIEWVLSRFETNGKVMYADVGGVDRRLADAVVTADSIRSTSSLSETGVWWRVFAGGSTDYRHTTSLEEKHLEDLMERSVRAARMLDQEIPAQYDQGTIQRATHPGWGSGGRSLDGLTVNKKAERVQAAVISSFKDLETDRSQAFYKDETINSCLMSTMGTAVHSMLDRISTDTVVVLSNGPKLSQHTGTTSGEDFFDVLSSRFEKLADRCRVTMDVDQTTLNEDLIRDIVFSPIAAGSLFHQLSHYFEIDSVYFGSSPLSIGDSIGPSTLTIEDTICAGSWAGRAFDAEGRSTQPVTLVSNGEVRNFLYDVSAAIEEEAHPSGHLIPSIGFQNPPRIHSRHLKIKSGNKNKSKLYEGADVAIEQLGPPRIANEATRRKRKSMMPPSTLYAKDIAAITPSDFEDEKRNQEIHFPVQEGYLLQDGERESRLTNGEIVFSLNDLQRMTAIGSNRETVTGTCTKNKSTLPYAVTAPPIRMETTAQRR